MPARLLLLTATGDELVPTWLTDHDRPWLRDVLGEAAAFAGQPFAALARHWRTAPRDPRPGRRLAIARHVLQRLLRRTAAPPTMTRLRQRLFTAAATMPRDDAFAAVAREHGLDPRSLANELFADLPHARRIVWPTPPPEPAWFALLTNLAIAQSLLRHATTADLELDGASRTVLKTAWLHGASFAIDADPHVRLRWRARTERRGALAAIAPVLPWARRFVLRAHCRIGEHRGTFVLATGDPILPGPEPRRFDSALEHTFANEFATLVPGGALHREPRPLVVDGRLCFPDFALHAPGGEQWLVEIAGLRDRRALPHKLAALAAVPHYVLCLPKVLVPADFTDHPRIVPFTRRVDVGDVLTRIRRPPPP